MISDNKDIFLSGVSVYYISLYIFRLPTLIFSRLPHHNNIKEVQVSIPQKSTRDRFFYFEFFLVTIDPQKRKKMRKRENERKREKKREKERSEIIYL